MFRSITSHAGFGANLLEEQGKHSPEEVPATLTRENRRDRINADNLKWLIDTPMRAGRSSSGRTMRMF
jgi:hypothetical protein